MKIEVYSPTIRRREMDAVLTAMVEDKIGPGEQTKFLIQAAREKLQFDYCLALRSPAIALYRALKALDLEKGQGVMVSALSPLYYARVVKDLGLELVCCDVLSSTACAGRETVEKALAVKGAVDVRCIALHHALGYLSDIPAVAELGIPVIEDCSRSYGSLIGAEPQDGADAKVPETKPAEEKPAPSAVKQGAGEDAARQTFAGNFGVFSILGLEERDMLTSGGGALLYSANRRDAAALRGQGDLPPEYGLPDMNAALAVVQFKEVAKNLAKRREIAQIYTQAALRTRHKRFVQNDILGQSVEYNNYAFPLVLETGMKDVKAYARRKDIAVESAFDSTLIGSGMVPADKCPEAYSLSLRTVLFPMYPRLRMTDAEKVSKLILTLP